MGSSITAAKFWNNVVQDVQVAVGVKSGAQVEKERLATKRREMNAQFRKINRDLNKMQSDTDRAQIKVKNELVKHKKVGERQPWMMEQVMKSMRGDAQEAARLRKTQSRLVETRASLQKIHHQIDVCLSTSTSMATLADVNKQVLKDINSTSIRDLPNMIKISGDYENEVLKIEVIDDFAQEVLGTVVGEEEGEPLDEEVDAILTEIGALPGRKTAPEKNVSLPDAPNSEGPVAAPSAAEDLPYDPAHDLSRLENLRQ